MVRSVRAVDLCVEPVEEQDLIVSGLSFRIRTDPGHAKAFSLCLRASPKEIVGQSLNQKAQRAIR